MNLPQYSAAMPIGKVQGAIAPLPKVLANGRISRVDQLKAQPRKPGEASFFYADHHFQYDAVKVLPGEYYVSNEDLVVMTVLGSCIAAC
ncbi:MAG: chemoreceptor glutamine deamidase CheD, partial [Rhodoferax sp.]